LTTPLTGTKVRGEHVFRGAGSPVPHEPTDSKRNQTMKIRPLHDRVIVKRMDEETKTAGGLFIPDTAKEKPVQAKVIAVGAGKRDKDGKLTALDVKVGDRVLFSKYSGSEIKIDGDEHLIMREEDLLAVLD
jgi:chaperonin GroES